MRVVKVYDEVGEWEGFYVNGELIQEDHTVTFEDLVDYLVDIGVIDSYDTIEVVTEDSLPINLSDVKKV